MPEQAIIALLQSWGQLGLLAANLIVLVRISGRIDHLAELADDHEARLRTVEKRT